MAETVRLPKTLFAPMPGAVASNPSREATGMPRIPSRLNHLAQYRELYLTTIALLLILSAECVFGPALPPVAAEVVTAITVTALGLSAWLGRRRQARLVAQAIAEARAMLKDRINNQLQIVMTHIDPGLGGYAADRERLREATEAVYAVSKILDDLSPQAMRTWRNAV